MGAVRETGAMIAGMAPALRTGRFVFCTMAAAEADRAAQAARVALGWFREPEGLSLILPEDDAHDLGFDTALAMACITLTVHSALDGIGLTAAVAETLTIVGIPCNMVAAYHHDHVFVPADRADEALRVLRERAG